MSAPNKSTTKPESQTAETQGNDGKDLNVARTEAATAERDRIAGIVNCEAAKDRPKLANHLAFSTSMSVEEATAMLNFAGVEKQAEATQTSAEQTAQKDESSHFMSAMDKSQHPEVGANGAESTAAKDADSLEQSLTSMGYSFN